MQVIPPFENPDELQHVGYIIHVARHWKLPRVTWPPKGLYDHEGFQPPLYYAFSALFFRDIPDPVRPPQNPAFRFAPVSPGGGPHRRYQPITASSPAELRAIANACTRLRFINLFWGLLAAICAAALFWRLANCNPAQAITALAIFLLNPRWIEAAASVSNDVAATATATLTFLLIIHLLNKKEISLAQTIIVGISCAIAVLSKANNAGLILIGILVPILKAKKRWWAVAVFLVSSLVPLLPWMLRNHSLYGDLLAANPALYQPFVGSRSNPLGWIQFFLNEFQGFRWSYFAVFGQFAVLTDLFVYPILDLFLLISGIAGAIALFIDVRSKRTKVEQIIVLLPLLWLFVIFIEFLSYDRTIFASQGRLIYPAAAFIAYFLAAGCMLLTPQKRQKMVAAIISAAFTLFAFYVGFSVLPRAY
ncbi:MAG: hypothetical protein C5B54_11170 [Acidobacteria bacterium]|nr:MAG: hypothetical protein C5B54_11170 [Acidobacteriota bacterium]